MSPETYKQISPGGARGLRNKIESVLHGDGDSGSSSFLSAFLYTLSLGYFLAAQLRAVVYSKAWIKRKRLPCMVISIGNLTVGGTGKTPMTIYVVRLLLQWGYKVAIVSRGYGGGRERSGGIVSDGRKMCMDVGESGDEPYLMAMTLRGVPVLVGGDRFRVGALAVEHFDPDVIVLDDGFQHMQLHRDLDLVLLDAAHPFGNGHLLPRGALREPLTQMKRADAFILTRCATADATHRDRSALNARVRQKPVFTCRHVPEVLKNGSDFLASPPFSESLVSEPRTLKGRKLLAFSGIARNDDFRLLLQELGGDVVVWLAFPDHHPYSAEDMHHISLLSSRHPVDFIVTTEKDFVRVSHRLRSIRSGVPVLALGIEISFGDEAKQFHLWLADRVQSIFRR